jgi:hypothetical protein
MIKYFHTKDGNFTYKCKVSDVCNTCNIRYECFTNRGIILPNFSLEMQKGTYLARKNYLQNLFNNEIVGDGEYISEEV